MAIFTQGVLAGSISGTVGGTTFANARSAGVVKRSQRMAKSQTEDQILRQAYLRRAQELWNSATDAYRASWRAAALLRPFPNRLGQLRTLSGYQFYVKVQLNYPALSQLNNTDTPVIFSFAPPENVALSLSEAAGLAITFTSRAGPPVPWIFADMQRSFSTSPKSHYSRYSRLWLALMTTGTIDIDTAYRAKFGTPVVGEYLAFRVKSWTPGAPPSAPTYLQGPVVA